MKKIKGQATTHLVLTMKHNDDGVKERLDTLLTSFKRLRATTYFRKKCRGGMAAVEIKRGENSGLWHLHLHCVLFAGFINREKLSKLWYRASRGSSVLKLRRVTDEARAVKYIAKYATKGWANEVVESQGDLRECMRALRGRRLLQTWGAWRGDDLERPDSENVVWRRVGRLVGIYNAAVRGEHWAVGCFQSLGVIALSNAGVGGFKRILFDERKVGSPPAPDLVGDG